MIFKKIINQSTMFILLLTLFSSCMDPVNEPPEQYSTYVESVINNSSEGVPNGSFEDDLEFWDGSQSDWGLFRTLEVVTDSLDSLGISDSMAYDGKKYLRMVLSNSTINLNTSFNYNPGDTLDFSIFYKVIGDLPVEDGQSGVSLNFTAIGFDDNNIQVRDGIQNFYYTPEANIFSTSTDSSKLYPNGNWNQANIQVAYKDAKTSQVEFSFGFSEHWYGPGTWERKITVLVDYCQITKKVGTNTSPSEFSIPSTGDSILNSLGLVFVPTFFVI